MASLDLLRRFRTRLGAVATRIGTKFRTIAGQLLGRAEVEGLVSHTATLSVAGRLVPLAESVATQALSVDGWLAAVRTEVKNLYITQYVVGRGGLAQMTYQDWGRLGAMIKDQYGYLDKFAQYIESHPDLSVDYLKFRTQLYAQASREAFERGRSAVVLGLGADEAGWNLTPADHCETCVHRSQLGWQPIGPRGGFIDPETGECWPADGSTICLTKCKCYLSYRNTATGEEFAEGGPGSDHPFHGSAQEVPDVPY